MATGATGQDSFGCGVRKGFNQSLSDWIWGLLHRRKFTSGTVSLAKATAGLQRESTTDVLLNGQVDKVPQSSAGLSVHHRSCFSQRATVGEETGHSADGQ